MSITTDIRAYAGTALEQGKLAVEQTRHAVEQAQNQFGELTGSVANNANQFVGRVSGTARENAADFGERANEAVQELRTQAEKTLRLDAVRSAVQPYLDQAREYGDRAETAFGSVLHDPRVARVVGTAETLTGVVVDTVTQRVIKPVGVLGRLGGAPAEPAAKPAGRSGRKPASTRPASRSGSAGKAAPKQAGTRGSGSAEPRKSTARKSTARKSTAARTSGAGSD